MIMSSRGEDQTLGLWHKTLQFCQFLTFYPDISHNKYRKWVLTWISMMAGLKSDCLAACCNLLNAPHRKFLFAFTNSHASLYPCVCLNISAAFLGLVTLCEWDPTSSSQSEINYSQLQSLNLVSRLPIVCSLAFCTQKRLVTGNKWRYDQVIRHCSEYNVGVTDLLVTWCWQLVTGDISLDFIPLRRRRW